ncbi:phospholipase A2-like [Sorex araneus]|uniref:phospholipase A2-like n=1 Tax=Sorex araneus TaxID=42254 RepID=UPI0024338DBE|nr:phospholipase A2-like [Sorex araneus]
MKLLVLAAWLSVADTAGGARTRAFWQFGNMISCLIPNISPYHTFNKYGCFCGRGGKGAPVDALDRCCQTHDRCWGQAVELGHCSSLLGFMTLLRIYSYSCTDKDITCSSENGPCTDFLCKCDRAAAICFAKAPRPREEYYNLDREKFCRE